MKLLELISNAITERKGQSKTIGKALTISLINQVVSSGTNFVLALYLVRVLATADFGLYGIGFALTLLYAGVGDALFLTPMVVHVPDKAPQDRLFYAARIFVALVLFCALTAIIAEVLLAVSGSWSQMLQNNFGLGSSIVSASIAYLLKVFYVRHSYTARKESGALWINVSVAVTLALMLFAQSLYMKEFNYEDALWFYAISNMFGALTGFTLYRLPIMAVSLQEIIEDTKEAWIVGRWALIGVGVTWAQNQAYLYITAILIGPVGVGLANAAKILITPALFFIPAITQLLMPRLAALRVTNQSKMVEICILFSVFLLCFSATYSIVLLSIGDLLTHILINKYSYSEIVPLAVAWCLLLIFQFSRVGTVVCLQVTKEFRLLTLLNVMSLVPAIFIAALLVQITGVQGAILGSSLGELIFSVLLYKAVTARYYKKNNLVSS